MSSNIQDTSFLGFSNHPGGKELYEVRARHKVGASNEKTQRSKQRQEKVRDSNQVQEVDALAQEFLTVDTTERVHNKELCTLSLVIPLFLLKSRAGPSHLTWDI